MNVSDEIEHTITVGLKTAGTVRFQKASKNWVVSFAEQGSSG